MVSPKFPLYERPFWLITLSLIFILVVSQLVQDGMFMDGLLYVCVSKNLANGLGTFWHPHFSKTCMSVFHEQPPLYFGLLALFYKVFGESLYVERFFCLVTLVITALYIHKIWKIVFRGDAMNIGNSWLPVLLWITIPVCFWSYSNLVEETVMSVFTIISIYYILKGLVLEKNQVLNILIGAFFVFLASLTKGFQGLFPCVAVSLYWIFNHRNFPFKKGVLFTLILVLLPAMLYALLLRNPVIYASYELYFKTRLIDAFNTKATVSTTGNRFELLFRLFCELLPALVVSVFVFVFGKVKKVPVRKSSFLKFVVWFFVIGLSGSLPLMVTLEQREFYLTTSFPFFSIALAIFITPVVSAFQNKMEVSKKSFQVFYFSSCVFLAGSIMYCMLQLGGFSRDKILLKDIYTMNRIIPYGETISIPGDMWNDWSIRMYFNRYNYVSLEDVNVRQCHFYLARKNSVLAPVLANYDRVPLKTDVLELYELREVNN